MLQQRRQGVHSYGYGQRGLVHEDHDEEAAGASTAKSLLAIPSLWSTSARQLNLHAYDVDAQRKAGYMEVKIGGHTLDYKRMLADGTDPHPSTLHGPRKTTRGHASTWLTTVTPVSSSSLFLEPDRHSRYSISFAAHDRPVLEYAAVKIGGHAMDHVRFLDRGQPSRPLWEATGRSNLVHTVDQVGIPRPLANIYNCSGCGRVRQSPRVQLQCGHALCSRCISSESMQYIDPVDHNDTRVVHNVDDPHPQSPRSCPLLHCQHCDGFVSIEAIVFAHRVIQFPRASDESVAASSSNSVHILPHGRGGVGAVVTAAVVIAATLARRYGQTRPVAGARGHKQLTLPPTPTSTPTSTPTALLVEDGATRWHKRVSQLSPPSKLLTYSFVRTLGVGAFAEVMLVRDRRGALTVLKESDKLQEAVNEIHLLSRVRSPHVVRVFEYFVEELAHRQFAYIAMEYCDEGDLLDVLRRRGDGVGLTPAVFDDIFRQICLGLVEIHTLGIVHRDLKPANVLLTSDGVAKITDFGVSTRLDSDLVTHHAAGTLAFMAPEVRRYFLGQAVSYDTRADIWSLGALAVVMLTGDPEPLLATQSVDQVVDALTERGVLVSPKYSALVRGALTPEPDQRITLTELLELFPPAATARL